MVQKKFIDLHAYVDREDWEFCLDLGKKEKVSGAEILRRALKKYRTGQ